jgi:hypothetical protein
MEGLRPLAMHIQTHEFGFRETHPVITAELPDFENINPELDGLSAPRATAKPGKPTPNAI